MSDPAAPSRVGRLDAFAYAGLLPSLVASALVWVAALAMTPTTPARPLAAIIALAFAGTLFVYNVDRLRDLSRDHESSPLRSRYIESNQPFIVALTVLAALTAGSLALAQTPRVWGLCAVVLVLGLGHRRLKAWPIFKLVYVTAAWVGIAVGLPALCSGCGDPDPGRLVVLMGVLGPALAANLLVSDLRDAASDLGRGHLRWARALALGGVAWALLAGFLPIFAAGPEAPIWPLAAVPGAEAIALWRFRRGERYGLIVADGALAVGAGVAAVGLIAAS